MLERIILHWTAGAWGVIDMEREHYHELIDRHGQRIPGKLRPEANISTADGVYAAHTRALNTGSIGIALDAMAGARQSPFHAGRWPVTHEMIEALADAAADHCETYGIPVSRETVLSHAEVEPTLGVRQRGKWDITWLPGMEKPGDPVDVGDILRDLIAARLAVA